MLYQEEKSFYPHLKAIKSNKTSHQHNTMVKQVGEKADIDIEFAKLYQSGFNKTVPKKPP